MDVSKIKAAIDSAHKELNTVIDGEFKERRVNGLRTLGLAANALTLAATHLDKAVKQVTPKETEAPKTTASKKK